ncbi:MAG: pyruvate ferredoxin oxidoreductase [Candidatus Woesearchaeota archaeon]
MKEVIEASEAVARAAALCKPAVIPMYPITPQTHIVEKLASMISKGELDAEMIHAESEHSALSAAIGASATGARVFTATSAQGLALMHEVLFIASGMRLPIVMAVANRSLSAPINIWNDQQDTISERDSGWVQLYAESAQEALDTTIMAFKIAESKKVLLPVMVCIDGFTLSHLFEPVEIPEQKDVNRFLPEFKPEDFLDPKSPKSFGPIAFPNTYAWFRKMQQEAMKNAVPEIKRVNLEFKKSFGRAYGDGLIEEYMMQDAEYAIIAIGSVCGTIRSVIDEMRSRGKRYGMIRIKSLRPFPQEELKKSASRLKGICVIDRNLSPGLGGAVVNEVRAVLPNKKVCSAIAGLGGMDITPEHIKEAFRIAERGSQKEHWLLK